MLCVYLCYVYSYTNFIIITWNMDMASSDNWGNLEELGWICYYVHDIALSVILICYLLVINCCSLTCSRSLLSSCTCFKSQMLCIYCICGRPYCPIWFPQVDHYSLSLYAWYEPLWHLRSKRKASVYVTRSAKRGLIAFLITSTWQPLSLLVNLVSPWKFLHLYS